MQYLSGRLYRNICHKKSNRTRRALKIIKAEEKRYEELLRLFSVEKLQIRRDKLCEQYMDKIKNQNHQLNMLIPRQGDREPVN